MSDDILQRDHKSYRGKILYTSKKPERMDQERGREYFMINLHANGKRTMIAHCEIDDRPSVMRDITYSLDENWMPMDCFVRISVNDDFMGSGWFNCTDDSIECEAFTKLEARVSQEMKTLDRKAPHSFQNHAIAADAWHMRMYDREKGGIQKIPELLLSSPDHRGATGPMLFRAGLTLNFIGEEQVTVGAGTFAALLPETPTVDTASASPKPIAIWRTRRERLAFIVIKLPPMCLVPNGM